MKMDRSAINYLNYLEKNDIYFYKNFKEIIAYASGVNKSLNDEDYSDLKMANESKYNITLKDHKTTLNMVKNFYYKISPSIIKQIDFDTINNNIIFKSCEEMQGQSSNIKYENGNYKIEIASTGHIDESFALAKEYANIFVSDLIDASDREKGEKCVYVEMVSSLTEFALAKHFSTNTVIKNDSKKYIFKKIYDSIYKLNDSYLTLNYLGYLLQNKKKEEIIKIIGDEKTVNHLDSIIREQKPCNDYISTLGTLLALKQANDTENIYDRVNELYIKSATKDINYFIDNIPIKFDQKETINEITYYVRSSK